KTFVGVVPATEHKIAASRRPDLTMAVTAPRDGFRSEFSLRIAIRTGPSASADCRGDDSGIPWNKQQRGLDSSRLFPLDGGFQRHCGDSTRKRPGCSNS